MIGNKGNELQHSQATSFDDDTRMKRKIETEDDVALLQILNRLLNWADTNNMKMNNEKFELMRYGPLDGTKQSTIATRSISKTSHLKNTCVTWELL